MKSTSPSSKSSPAKIKYNALPVSPKKHTLQVDLFDEAELEEDITGLFNQLPKDFKEDDQQAQWELRKKNNKRNRQFAPHLERVKIKHTLTDEEKAGATGTFFVK